MVLLHSVLLGYDSNHHILNDWLMKSSTLVIAKSPQKMLPSDPTLEGELPTGATRPDRLLVVDDEASIRRILETRFKMQGYDTATAADGEEAIDVFNRFAPDVVILDIMMPKIDGYGVTKEIRKTHDTPIIILTALGDVAERITGLELGADDYVVKPFSPKELEARVKALLRRSNGTRAGQPVLPLPGSSTKENVVMIGSIKIDTAKRQVFRKAERVRLTGMEFSLLELLVTNSGKPFSRGDILQHVWSYPPDHRIDTRVVDVHISRLRAKLENDISNPELILTARGIGYMFQKFE
jgi:two-component system, OmpR family, response regulator RpaB